MELKLYYNYENKLLYLVVESTKGVQYFEIGCLKTVLSDLKAENKIKDSDYLVLLYPHKWTLNRVKELTRLILKDKLKRLNKSDIMSLISYNSFKWRQ
jgi:hypothetical protein